MERRAQAALRHVVPDPCDALHRVQVVVPRAVENRAEVRRRGEDGTGVNKLPGNAADVGQGPDALDGGIFLHAGQHPSVAGSNAITLPQFLARASACCMASTLESVGERQGQAIVQCRGTPAQQVALQQRNPVRQARNLDRAGGRNRGQVPAIDFAMPRDVVLRLAWADDVALAGVFASAVRHAGDQQRPGIAKVKTAADLAVDAAATPQQRLARADVLERRRKSDGVGGQQVSAPRRGRRSWLLPTGT
mmetsp:Transcript_38687/g.90415  ORF Transcript_38687/g.90415 Transcript_38687/m.90415 type:complete len:249 (-) Transcript_38687:1493-2239(-)